MYSTQRIFYNACYKGYLNIVKLCIECGADIHADYNWVLKRSIYHNQYEVVKYLLEKGADPYNNYWDCLNAFQYANVKNRREIQILLEQYR